MTDVQPQFDVFLAHNSQDKPLVRAIANELRRRGLNPWLDEEEILGGDPILETVYNGILQSKAGAFFISQNGLGNFQENIELYTVIDQFLTRKRQSQSFRVIPILLPGVTKVPDKIGYLNVWRWIQFTQLNDEAALEHLVRSIRRQEAEVLVTQNPVIQSNDLSSETGVDYRQLRDFLKAGQWKEADQETLAVMLEATGREEEGWLSTECIENFPCTDLRTIDQLWVKYSGGRFGFSVQKRIWESVGEDYQEFGARVGWRKAMFWNNSWLYYNELTFSTNAPQGHLPVCEELRWDQVYTWIGTLDWTTRVSSLASRLVNCNI